MSISFADLTRIFDEVISLDDVLGVNDRFMYVKARRVGSWYFVKIAKQAELIENLERECLWAEFMDRVDVLNPTMRLRGQHLVQRIGDDGLVFEYIDAPQVAPRGDAERWRANLQRYADMHVQLDKAAGDFSLPRTYTYLSNKFEPAGNSWKEWVVGHVDQKIIDEAKSLFAEYERNVTLRLQHNDMSPWQIFDIDGQWVIFDGEKAGVEIARFNDIAQSYVRMHNTAHDERMAKDFLEIIIAGIGMSRKEFYAAFIPVLTLRSVGSLADSDIDGSTANYQTEAMALVEKCLSRDQSRI